MHLLFVCHGNICRSPMAECIMKDLVNKAGLSHQISVSSAALTTEEIGHDMYPPARRMLTAMGIPFSPRRARLMSRTDYTAADLVLAMDEENLYHLRRLIGDDEEGKIHLLMEYAGEKREVGSVTLSWTKTMRACDNKIRKERSSCPNIHVPAESIQMPLKPR